VALSGAVNNSATACTVQISTAASDGSTTGASGVSYILWGAQLIVTNSLLSNAYQRIAAATDYDTAGFLPYLAFDGTDDSLLTNSVDFSATDKMTVWAGVRKLSDAARGMLVELNTGATDTGIFNINAPNASLGNFSFVSAGGTVASAVATIAAPATQVLTGIGDINAPLAVIRTNGAQAAAVTTSQGSGNYLNAALYIGRRGGASLPFNGNLYSLIIRGAQSNASQISATESWVAQKTGVTL